MAFANLGLGFADWETLSHWLMDQIQPSCRRLMRKRRRAEEGMVMPARSRIFRVLPCLLLFLFLEVVFAVGEVHRQAPVKGTESAAAPAASPGSLEVSKYVGAETCKTCHEEIYNGWEKTPHWKTTLDTKGGPSHQGCEGCHGPGSDHVAAAIKPKSLFLRTLPPGKLMPAA